jgi:hypothetical protein
MRTFGIYRVGAGAVRMGGWGPCGRPLGKGVASMVSRHQDDGGHKGLYDEQPCPSSGRPQGPIHLT